MVNSSRQVQNTIVSVRNPEFANAIKICFDGNFSNIVFRTKKSTETGAILKRRDERRSCGRLKKITPESVAGLSN